jgi:hypothetical protein
VDWACPDSGESSAIGEITGEDHRTDGDRARVASPDP